MTEPTGVWRGRAVWLLRLALFYLGVALVLGTEDYLLGRHRAPWASWFFWVGQRIPQWIVWTIWTPLVVSLGGRFRVDREPRWRNMAVHVAAVVVIVPFIVASDVFLLEVMTLPGATRSLGEKFLENFRAPVPAIVGWMLVAAFAWVLVLTVSYAWRYRKEAQEQQLAASRLQAELVQAQLQSLKSQLRPHFLFNALNAVSTLVTKDPPTAKRMVLLLSGLLRRALTEADAQEVPLSQEIEFARAYLEIEQVRFSNRLTVDVSVEPGVERALVPHLLLQPLVENAVRHGIGPKAEPGTVRIEAGVEGDSVRLAVIDDGAGRSRAARSGGAGVGLANIRARLAGLYGDAARLECGERAEGGFTATVVLPLRRQSVQLAGVGAPGDRS